MPDDLIPVPSPGLPALAVADLYAAVLTGRNARTVRAYASDYADFARFAGAPSPAAALDALVALPAGPAHALALAYRGHLIGRGLAAATVARRLAALRSAVKLARQFGRVGWALEVEPPAVTAYRDTAGPGDSGWRRLLDAAKARALDSPKGRRDLALIRLLHDTALRRAEVLSLNVADVDLTRGTAQVVRKGRTAPEPVTLPPPVVRDLERWLADRGDSPGPVFVRLDRARNSGRWSVAGDQGRDSEAPGDKSATDHRPLTTAQRLTGRGLAKIVAELGRAAQLSRPLRPHGLRHAGITRALDVTGGDVRRVQRFSGHRKIDTVIRYDDNRQDLGGQVARLVSDE